MAPQRTTGWPPGTFISPVATIDDDVTIGCGVVVHAGSEVAAGAMLQDHAVIGKPLQLGRLSSQPAPEEEPPATVIGAGAKVLCGAVIVAGAAIGPGVVAGDGCHVRERASIGPDSTIGRGVAIDNDVVVGSRVRIQTAAYVTGHSVIEDDVFIGPGVVTTNDNSMARHPPAAPTEGVCVRRAARIGGGVVICPGLEIGEEAFLAAGAVITADVEPRAVMMGSPARRVREVPDEDLIERWR